MNRTKIAAPEATGTAENKSNPIERKRFAMEQTTSTATLQVQRVDRADLIPLAMVLTSIRPNWDVVELVDHDLRYAAEGRTLAELTVAAVVAAGNPKNGSSVLRLPGRHWDIAATLAGGAA